MPQTSGERSWKFRKKLREDSKLYEVCKTKDRERKKAGRRLKFQSPAEIKRMILQTSSLEPLYVLTFQGVKCEER